MMSRAAGIERMSAKKSSLLLLFFAAFGATPSKSDPATSVLIVVVTYNIAGEDANTGEAWSVSRTLTLQMSKSNVRVSRNPSGSEQVVKFGEAYSTHNGYGLEGKKILHIVNGSVVVTTIFPGYTSRMVIQTDGKTTCSALGKYRLNPSYSKFDLGGGHFGRNLRIETVNCSIRLSDA